MFTKIKLQNFRTHINSEIKLKDLTLLIGANNSGKSNFLIGLHFFSKLLSYYFPNRAYEFEANDLRESDYYSNKHSLSTNNEPILFSTEWFKENYEIKYVIEIYPDSNNHHIIYGKEKLIINDKIYKSGYNEPVRKLLLRKIIEDSESPYKKIIGVFFRELANFHYYNFQPSFLKGFALPLIFDNKRKKYVPNYHKDFIELRERSEQKKYPFIPAELGKEGHNLQPLLKYIIKYEKETYLRFLGYLKRFIDNFNGILEVKNQIKWQFDFGGNNFPYFSPDKISDGMIKAAAVALLCSLKNKPSIIMIEEVENGINQKKIAEFLNWLKDASNQSQHTQFIITSHSPSVIREFYDNLSAVYNVHLRKKDYKSILTNLNDAFKPLVNMGTINNISKEEDKIIIPKNEVIELFYNGIIGEI